MNTFFLILAAVAVRNPFWPIGHEGERQPITSEPIIDVKANATSDADDTATGASTAITISNEITAKDWTEARKTMKIGGTITVTAPDGKKRHCLIINGRAYGDNDLISINHEDIRFTWRVCGLTEGATLKLKRVRARQIDMTNNEGEQQ